MKYLLVLLMGFGTLAVASDHFEKFIGSVNVPLSKEATVAKDRAIIRVELSTRCFPGDAGQQDAVDALNAFKADLLDALEPLQRSGDELDQLNAPGSSSAVVTLQHTVIKNDRALRIDDEQCTNVGVAGETVTLDTGASKEAIAEALDKILAATAANQAELSKQRGTNEERTRVLNVETRSPIYYADPRVVAKTVKALKREIADDRDGVLQAAVKLSLGGAYYVSSSSNWSISAPQKPEAPQPKFAHKAGLEMAMTGDASFNPTQIVVADGKVVVARQFQVRYIPKEHGEQN